MHLTSILILPQATDQYTPSYPQLRYILQLFQGQRLVLRQIAICVKSNSLASNAGWPPRGITKSLFRSEIFILTVVLKWIMLHQRSREKHAHVLRRSDSMPSEGTELRALFIVNFYGSGPSLSAGVESLCRRFAEPTGDLLWLFELAKCCTRGRRIIYCF